MPEGTPDWAKFHYDQNNKTFIVPVKIINAHNTSSRTNAYVYLVVILNDEGNVASSNYVMVLVDKTKPNSITQLNITSSLLSLRGAPVNFNGFVLKYDMDNRWVSSHYYKDGKSLIGTTGKISGKPSETVSNFAPIDCENGQNCADWYLVTYVDGEMVSAEFLFRTCQQCAEGSGGGGDESYSCAQQFVGFIAAGQAVSGPITIDVTSETLTTANIVFSWKIFTAGTWFITSIEDATIAKYYIIDPNGGPDRVVREFESFTHRNMFSTGSSFGGSRSFIDLGASINFGEVQTGVLVHFSVTHTPMCLPGISVPPPLTKQYNSTGVFVANAVSNPI